MSYQDPGKKLPSTRELFSALYETKDESAQEKTTVTFAQQTPKKRRPASLRGEPSPQMSAKREPMRFIDDGSDEKGTRYKCSRHHRGRKPEHKDKRALYIGAIAPVAHRNMIDLYL
jgi:hypothetical protein